MVFMSAVLPIGLQIKRLIGKNSHYRNRKKKEMKSFDEQMKKMKQLFVNTNNTDKCQAMFIVVCSYSMK